MRLLRPRLIWLMSVVLVVGGWPLWNQATDWKAGIAKITAKGKSPGTGFVVSIRSGRAYVVTCAHVVEGDPNPIVRFQVDPENEHPATVRHVEAGEVRGLAILIVSKPPAGVYVIPEPAGAPLSIGERVTVAGYPAPRGVFFVAETTIASLEGRDVILDRQTGEGFSGGPVLRGGAVVALIYGRDATGGLAVRSSAVKEYLNGFDFPLRDGAQAEAAQRVEYTAVAGLIPGTVRTNPADGQSYVWVPPGSFQMGCSTGDSECFDPEKPAHPVRISKGFWMGQTEVTQGAYEKVTGNNPSNLKGPQQPVEKVIWNEATAYCKAAGGRLPTEAEWEYAARAGTTGARYGDLEAIAWYADNSGKSTKPVRTKQPNAWGLYGMLGNVWEWCQDWHGPYESGEQADPQGPTSGKERVVRGGSWHSNPRNVRVSNRSRGQPEDRSVYLGFRCVREVIP